MRLRGLQAQFRSDPGQERDLNPFASLGGGRFGFSRPG